MVAAQNPLEGENPFFEDKGLRPALRARLRAVLGEGVAVQSGRALGLSEVDSHLPASGVVLAAMHEITPRDFRAGPAALGYLLALAKTVTAAREGPFFWPLLTGTEQGFGLPYAAGLKRFGFDPGRFVFARCSKAKDALWAMEEALRLGSVAAVIATCPPRMDLTVSRRLQLAAEATATPIFLFRPYGDHAVSAARTSWRVAPFPAARDRFGLLTNARWRVALERVRGGRPGEWIMEWNDDARALHLSPAISDRKIAAGKTKKAA